MATTLQLLTCSLPVVLYFLWRRSGATSLPLPPGPKGYPLIGNLRDFPTVRPWETFHRWRREYGDILYLRIFGMSMIVLNSPAVVHALLDKRAGNYSHRPWLPMMNELMGFDWPIFVLTGERAKASRALALKYFITKVNQYQQTQSEEAQALLKRLLVNPGAFLQHTKTYAGNIVMRIGYGFSMKGEDDPLITVMEEALDYFSRGRFMVDFFPILKLWPEWLPGGEFKRIARKARVAMTKMRDIPFETTKAHMTTGEVEPCFVTTLLAEIDRSGDIKEQETMIRDCAGTMYGAGTHTTAATLKAFILAMMLHPDVQKRAQREINRVVGPDRLPTFSDRQDLPYLDALMKELLRWTVNVPLAMPHYVVDDDVYEGRFIPGKSTVLGNMWALFRDPDVFPEPEKFDPLRFLSEGNNTQKEVVGMAFGWGKRVCPGRHLAEASLFIAMAALLATFEFIQPANEHGGEYGWVKNLLREPMPYQCTVKVRSDKARALVEGL